MNYKIFAEVLSTAVIYLDMREELYSDPDVAVQGQEDLVTALSELKPEEAAALDEALQQVALEYTGETRELVKTIARDFGFIDDPDD